MGPALKPGIVRLRELRNHVVQALGYPDYFSYQVSDYGMSTDEMLRLNDQLVRELRPLYRELHTWARYELAKRYRVPVPDQLPAHWLPNRWGQDWSSLVEVKGLDVDKALARKSPEWVVRQGEGFYRSLGFDSLPATFWAKSSLYPLAANAPYKKNTHASAWHMDLDRDVRSLMSVEPNREWYETVHHELGHIYYYMSYSRPEVPIVLREGANRAYHEGLGSMIGLASLQRRFLAGRGLVSPKAPVDSMAELLQEALAYVVFIPFAAGTMTRFEHALYAENLPPAQFNAKWWELAREYQGIVPPRPAGRALGRRAHQDPHQRRPGPVLRLRPFLRAAVPAARSYRAPDPEAGSARHRLLRPPGGGRLSPPPDGARSQPALAGDAARDHRPGARREGDGRVLRAALPVAPQAERGPQGDAAGYVNHDGTVCADRRTKEFHGWRGHQAHRARSGCGHFNWEIPDGGMLAGHAQGEAVLLARPGADWFAISATCSHYSGPLAGGTPGRRHGALPLAPRLLQPSDRRGAAAARAQRRRLLAGGAARRQGVCHRQGAEAARPRPPHGAAPRARFGGHRGRRGGGRKRRRDTAPRGV